MLMSILYLCTYENTNRYIFGISKDTIFTTSITISIFIIGILANIFIKYLIEKNQLKHIKNYFYNSVDTFSTKLKKQIRLFEDLKSEVVDIESRNYSFPIQSDLLFDTLAKIENLDLFKIFVSSNHKGEKSKNILNYSNIIGSIEFVKNQLEISQINFNRFFSDIRNYEHIRGEGVNKILRRWDVYLSYAKRENIRPSQDPFLKQFDLLMQVLKDDKVKISFTKLKKEFIDPLKKHCVEFGHDPRATELLSIIVNINEAQTNIKNAKDFYSSAFEEDRAALQVRWDLISESINYFKTT